jgi:hypothetical protein
MYLGDTLNIVDKYQYRRNDGSTDLRRQRRLPGSSLPRGPAPQMCVCGGESGVGCGVERDERGNVSSRDEFMEEELGFHYVWKLFI